MATNDRKYNADNLSDVSSEKKAEPATKGTVNNAMGVFDEPGGEGRRPATDCCRGTGAHTWYTFCQNTTLHGLKQVTEPQPYVLRRFIWLAFVLAGAGLFLYQMINGILYYYAWPVSVNVKINYNDTLRFPAITICNQNAFRSSVAYSLGYYPLLDETFSHVHEGEDEEEEEEEEWGEGSGLHVPLDQLHGVTAHTKRDFIVQCSFDGEDCGPEDFQTIATDFGICFSMNSSKISSQPRVVRRTGAQGGLRLLLNVEQYEYMPGPHGAAGVKLLVHRPEEAPLPAQFGIAIPPGAHAYVGMTLIQVENLPSPHGNCSDDKRLEYYDHYTKLNCLEDCKQRHVQQQCQCRDNYMPPGDSDGFRVCTMEDYHECVIGAIEIFNDIHNDCDCPIPCRSQTYGSSSSLGYISDFDTLRLLRNRRTDALQASFRHAIEVRQRVLDTIVQRDTELISQFYDTVSVISLVLEDLESGMGALADHLKAMFYELDQRLHFHDDKAIEKVLYIMEHDFVRGWLIIEERTLPYVCHGYKEIAGSIRRALRGLRETRASGREESTTLTPKVTEASVTEESTPSYYTPPPSTATGVAAEADIPNLVALSFWHTIANTLLERLDLVFRARENMTEVNDAYKTGTPLLTYEASRHRRYDMSYITVELLQAVIDDDRHDQDYFYLKYNNNLDGVERTTGVYLEMGRKLLDTGQLDESLLNENEFDYDYSCKYYNYYTFLLKTRIVDAPVEIMAKRIENFHRMERSLHSAIDVVTGEAMRLQKLIEDFRNSSWNDIVELGELSRRYLHDLDITKTLVAEDAASKATQKSLAAAKLFFAELRASGRVMQDRIRNLEENVINMWQNVLTEYTTFNFYKMVQDDFNSWKTTNDSFYIPYFANLLNVKVEDLANVTADELRFRMNADFYGMQLESVVRNENQRFAELFKFADVASKMVALDEEFDDSTSAYISSLDKYREDTVIDAEFFSKNFLRVDVYMEDLSYEEIIQHAAYDSLQLLGDIGGSFGLFLGASALSMAEILDLFVHQLFARFS